MSLDDISTVDLASTDTAIVRALRTREAAYRPAVGLVQEIEKCVLLLETEPRLMGLVSLHELRALMAVVELVWGSIGIPAFSDDQDVGGTTERIGEDGHRSEVNIRIVARSLTGRAAVKVPLRKILNFEFTALRDLGESLRRKIVSDSEIMCSRERLLTFDLERTPPVESIQMYLWQLSCVESEIWMLITHSAIALPFWSSFMYFMSYHDISDL